MAGLYIHIPFCVRKCKYCDFISFVEGTDVMERYLRALTREMELCAAEYGKLHFDTVFIGGGTPSILRHGGISAVLAAVRKYFSIAENAEITVECNPGTVDAEKLAEYMRVGVNRLSFGLQSANDEILRSIGRIHRYSDFLHSVELAREAGFSNINADIMYVLPGQTEADAVDTINKAAELGLPHISAYSLILEENTPLYMEVNSGVTLLPNEETEYAIHRAVIDALTGHGYRRYEISNYCREGMESRHNLNYWNNGEYLGVGLNSHSALHLPKWTRFNNTSDLNLYFSSIEAGRLPIEDKQEIGEAEEMFECVMLGLRKTKGISDALFRARFGKAMSEVYPDAITKLVKAKWLTYDAEAGYFMLTDEGLDMQNEALMYFMED